MVEERLVFRIGRDESAMARLDDFDGCIALGLEDSIVVALIAGRSIGRGSSADSGLAPALRDDLDAAARK